MLSFRTAFPFVRYLAALLLGILLYFQGIAAPDRAAPSRGGLVWVAGGVSLLFLLYLAGRFSRRSGFGKRMNGLGGLGLLVGFGWVLAYVRTDANAPGHYLHSPRPIEAYRAVVTSKVEPRAKTYRLRLQVLAIRTAGRWRPAGGRVAAYIDRAARLPRYGDRYLIRGAPRPVDPPLNPGQFDYRTYLAHQQIYRQHYLRAGDFRWLGHQPPNRCVGWAMTVNEWAEQVFNRHLKDKQKFAVVKAMVLGGQDAIDPELQQAYSAAGAVHVLSVSGLHVGVLFAALQFLLGFIKRFRYGAFLFAGLMLAVLWFYAIMAGFSAPVLRSAVMFSLILIGQTLGRRHQLVNTLAASAFVILLFDPYAITSAGFQLSYLAVGGLALWQRPFYQSLTFRPRWADWLWNLTSVALVAQLTTFPLGVYYFHQFPVYFWLANPVVIPLSSAVLIGGMGLLAVSWIPVVADWTGTLLNFIMWLLNQAVVLTEQLPYSVVKGVTLNGPELSFLYAALLAGVLLVSRRNLRYGGLMACCSTLLAFSVLATDVQRAVQRVFIVHAVPRQAAFSWIEGRLGRLAGDAALRPGGRQTEFYIRNTYDLLGAGLPPDTLRREPPAFHRGEFSVWTWQGKTIVQLKRGFRKAPRRFPFVIDYLIVSGNAVTDWAALKDRLVARHLILDQSNRAEVADRLLADARQKGLPCYSVLQQGAFVDRIGGPEK